MPIPEPPMPVSEGRGRGGRASLPGGRGSFIDMVPSHQRPCRSVAASFEAAVRPVPLRRRDQQPRPPSRGRARRDRTGTPPRRRPARAGRRSRRARPHRAAQQVRAPDRSGGRGPASMSTQMSAFSATSHTAPSPRRARASCTQSTRGPRAITRSSRPTPPRARRGRPARCRPRRDRRQGAYIASGLSWSMKASGRVSGRIFTPVSRGALAREEMEDLAAEAAVGPLLDGDEHLVLAREAQHEVAVDGLCEARIRHGGGEAARAKLLRRPQRRAEPAAEGEDRDGASLPQHPPAPDLERNALLRHLDADALPAGIAEGDRPLVVGGGGGDHVDEIGLVARRHHDHARKAAEIGRVEGAAVGRPVGAHEARPVDGEAHRQALDRDVVDHLVVAALKERRVDGAERLSSRPRRAPPRR